MPRPRTRSRLGEAIYRARKSAKMSQEELGAAVGIPQPRVSDWEGEAHQEVEEALELLGRIDLACGNGRGWMLWMADYIDRDGALNVAEAIAQDPALDEAGKELLLLAYDYCRRAAGELVPGLHRAQLTDEQTGEITTSTRGGIDAGLAGLPADPPAAPPAADRPA